MKTLGSNQSSPAAGKRQSQPFEARGRKLRNAVLVAAFMVALASLASADIYSDLTVNLGITDCINPGTCDLNTGFLGSPALGQANFSGLPGNPPWSYNFQTGPAYQWSNVPFGNTTYYALFNSGTFNMNGPYGLTFSGTVTSAEAWNYAQSNGLQVDVTFSGYWSDGIYATGTADVSSFFGRGPITNRKPLLIPQPRPLNHPA